MTDRQTDQLNEIQVTHLQSKSSQKESPLISIFSDYEAASLLKKLHDETCEVFSTQYMVI